MQMSRMLRQLMHRRIVMVSALVLLVIAVMAIGAPLFASMDPNDTAVLDRLKPPSAEHLLGTDELGRDMYARIVHGARYSLAIAALTALGSVIAGTVLGLMAGFFRRLDVPADARVIDAMMAFPDILLAIALVAILGPSLVTVIVALGIVYTPRRRARRAGLDAGDPRASCLSRPCGRWACRPRAS
jgi:peptide/nickel transport system permease protein